MATLSPEVELLCSVPSGKVVSVYASLDCLVSEFAKVAMRVLDEHKIDEAWECVGYNGKILEHGTLKYHGVIHHSLLALRQLPYHPKTSETLPPWELLRPTVDRLREYRKLPPINGNMKKKKKRSKTPAIVLKLQKMREELHSPELGGSGSVKTPLRHRRSQRYFWNTQVPASIQQIIPASGIVAGGMRVEIIGERFDTSEDAVEVYFGSEPATEVLVTKKTVLSCMTPKQSVCGIKPVTVWVNGMCSLEHLDFYYLGPVVRSIDPIGGPCYGGNTLTLEGLRLGNKHSEEVTVRIGGQLCKNVVVYNPKDDSRIDTRQPLPEDDGKARLGARTIKFEDPLSRHRSRIRCIVPAFFPTKGNESGHNHVTVTVHDPEFGVLTSEPCDESLYQYDNPKKRSKKKQPKRKVPFFYEVDFGLGESQAAFDVASLKTALDPYIIEIVHIYHTYCRIGPPCDVEATYDMKLSQFEKLLNDCRVSGELFAEDMSKTPCNDMGADEVKEMYNLALGVEESESENEEKENQDQGENNESDEEKMDEDQSVLEILQEMKDRHHKYRDGALKKNVEDMTMEDLQQIPRSVENMTKSKAGLTLSQFFVSLVHIANYKYSNIPDADQAVLVLLRERLLPNSLVPDRQGGFYLAMTEVDIKLTLSQYEKFIRMTFSDFCNEYGVITWREALYMLHAYQMLKSEQDSDDTKDGKVDSIRIYMSEYRRAFLAAGTSGTWSRLQPPDCLCRGWCTCPDMSERRLSPDVELTYYLFEEFLVRLCVVEVVPKVYFDEIDDVHILLGQRLEAFLLRIVSKRQTYQDQKQAIVSMVIQRAKGTSMNTTQTYAERAAMKIQKIIRGRRQRRKFEQRRRTMANVLLPEKKLQNQMKTTVKSRRRTRATSMASIQGDTIHENPEEELIFQDDWE